MDKCAYLNFRGRDQQSKLMGKDLENVAAEVLWKQHIEERMKKANKILFMPKMII